MVETRREIEKYSEIVPENHPLVGLCLLMNEGGLEVFFKTNPKLSNGLIISTSPDAWSQIRNRENLLSKSPEYQVLELAADGLPIATRETVAKHMGQLKELLSQCDPDIIPESLGEKIITSACRQTASLYEIAGKISIGPSSELLTKLGIGQPPNGLMRGLKDAASEFGGEPVASVDMEGAVRRLIRKLETTPGLK